MKVYQDGNIVTDVEKVLDKWKVEFESLYNNMNNGEEFDETFYTDMMNVKMQRELEMESDNYEKNEHINEPLSYDEVEQVINKLKIKKATGLDGIPNEVFLNIQMYNNYYINYFLNVLNIVYYQGYG